ncbi:hypothetical protein [Rheinheimera sp.]|uniref:hypothetical protein n=1 Tax=Rheinheimera sp. TaxID=1869214 RepID=UPI00404889A9
MPKVKKQDSPARDWIFRISNPKDKDWDKIWSMDYKYLVFSIEMGGETDTVHIQGFVQFRELIRLTGLKKIHRRAHWEKRRGTPYEAAHYCMKPVQGCDCKHCEGERVTLTHLDGPYEDGFISAESAYKAHEIARVIKAKGYHHAAERFPEAVLTMGRGMLLLDTHFTPKRDFKTEVTVIWGGSRLGKTRYAYEAAPSPYLLAVHGEGTDFFGNYDPRSNETVIVDDFYSSWKFTTFLRVCDRYPTEVHTKGGFLQFLARHIVFTSNFAPDQWYKNVLADPVRKDSFFNRIDNIIKFTRVGKYVVLKVKLKSTKN